MFYVDLDGNEHKINFGRNKSKARPSKLFKEAREVVKEILPHFKAREEQSIKVKKGKTLYLDMFIPELGMVIEVHGKQHYEKIGHFHSNEAFARARLNDDLKKEWCRVNKFLYIELGYKDDRDEWRRKLRGAIG